MKTDNQERLNNYFAAKEEQRLLEEKKKIEAVAKAEALQTKIALKKNELNETAFVSIKIFLEKRNIPIHLAPPSDKDHSITWNLWAQNGQGLDRSFFKIIFDHEKIRVEAENYDGKPFRAGPWPIDEVNPDGIESIFVSFYITNK